jgi:hypothetical protein
VGFCACIICLGHVFINVCLGLVYKYNSVMYCMVHGGICKYFLGLHMHISHYTNFIFILPIFIFFNFQLKEYIDDTEDFINIQLVLFSSYFNLVI